MDASHMANLAASGLVAVTSAVAAVVYTVRAPWWRSRIGRHIMTVTVSVALLGLYTVLTSLVWPAGPAASALRIGRTVLLVLLAVSMVQRTRLVIEAQRPVPPDRPPEGSP